MLWIIYFLTIIITFIIILSVDLYVNCKNYTKFDLFTEITFSITPIINLVMIIYYLVYLKRNNIKFKEVITLFFKTLLNKQYEFTYWNIWRRYQTYSESVS